MDYYEREIANCEQCLQINFKGNFCTCNLNNYIIPNIEKIPDWCLKKDERFIY